MPFDGLNYDEATTILLQAKALLEERGWCRGAGRTAGGHRCAIIALADVAARGADLDKEVEAVKRLARAMGFDNIDGIPAWNDTHSKEEVLAAFERAIAG